jgi:hypothetical protein
MFIVCTISINLHADVIECEVKEETGTVKVLDITSDKFLQPVLKELGGKRQLNKIYLPSNFKFLV